MRLWANEDLLGFLVRTLSLFSFLLFLTQTVILPQKHLIYYLSRNSATNRKRKITHNNSILYVNAKTHTHIYKKRDRNTSVYVWMSAKQAHWADTRMK